MLEEEAPTNSTDGVYSTSTYVPPTDSSEAEVPDPDPDNGITSGDDWTQPLGNDESGNPASSPPTSFPRIWNNPGYSDPTDGLLNKSDLHGDGAALPIYNLPDWQDPADVPDGGVGGLQIELGGMDPGVVGGYLDANGFHQTTGKLGGVTFKTHPELFQDVKYWTFFSIYNPFIDSYWPNNSLGRTPQYGGIVKGWSVCPGDSLRMRRSATPRSSACTISQRRCREPSSPRSMAASVSVMGRSSLGIRIPRSR